MSAKISKIKCVASAVPYQRENTTTIEADGTENCFVFFCTFETPIITIVFVVARFNQQLTVLLAVRESGHKLIRNEAKRNEFGIRTRMTDFSANNKHNRLLHPISMKRIQIGANVCIGSYGRTHAANSPDSLIRSETPMNRFVRFQFEHEKKCT